MTTIAAGTSQTFTALTPGQTFMVSSNSGAIVGVSGAATARLGPAPTRRTFGPFDAGQSISVSAGVGDVTVEYGFNGFPTASAPSGAVPSSSQSNASANSGSLQAQLTAALGGGKVTVSGGGNAYLSAAVYVGDYTELKTDRGTVLKVADGAQSSAVQTTPNAVAFTNVTVTWAAGSTASVAWAAHGCVPGDVIVLQGVLGTTLAGWFDVCRIISVTDAGTFVVQLPFVPTAAPTGQMTAKKCVRGLFVDIDLDHNFTNNPGTGQNLGRMASVFSFIADSTIRVRGKDAFKYVALLAGALNVVIEVYGLPNSHSDTLKVYGPARDITATVFGQAAEDCVTIQALEPLAFRAYMPCWGNIRAVTIRGNANQTNAGSAPAVVYSDDTFTTDGIVFEDLDCTTMAAANPAIAIKPGTGYSATASLIGDITVRRGRLSTISEAGILVTTKVRNLTLDHPKFKSPDADNLRALKITDVVAKLDVDLAFDGTTWPVSGTGYLVEILGTVNHATFRGVYRGTTNLRLVDYGANSVGTSCNFVDIDAESIDVICRIESTATTVPTVTIGGRFLTVLTGVNMRKSGSVVLDGVNASGMSNGIVRAEIAGTNVKVYEKGGATLAGTTVPVVCLTTATVDLYTPTLPVDVGLTGINKTAGACCINSGAARGTLVANHAVIANGTQWVQADTPANVF